MNMWKKNRRQIVAGIIAVILVLAMVGSDGFGSNVIRD